MMYAMSCRSWIEVIQGASYFWGAVCYRVFWHAHILVLRSDSGGRTTGREFEHVCIIVEVYNLVVICVGKQVARFRIGTTVDFIE